MSAAAMPPLSPVQGPRSREEVDAYQAIVSQLSDMSVRKAHDPYIDVPWDAPQYALSPADPRLTLPSDHPLASTGWYQGLAEEMRVRFFVAWTSQVLKYAIGFESVLSRGLLRFAQRLDNASPEYRYVMHEVVEETRHSMMFQELIRRLGQDPKPVSEVTRVIDDRVTGWGRRVPELFFFAVLGGEVFIDQQNRELLRRPRNEVHPLLRRVIQIHVTEEARHVCFAERYLEQHLPLCSPAKREMLAFIVPLTFPAAMRMMLEPDPRLVRAFSIPAAAMTAAFGPGSAHRKKVAETTKPVRALCARHGMLERRHATVWRRAGLAE